MAATSARTLQLLSLLQTHRFWPGGELADRLEVSERTLRRDIERLRDLGYPVSASRGVAGGYQLGQGASLPPLTLEEDEAIALVTALSAQAGTMAGPAAEASLGVLSKVTQVLPRRLKQRAEAVRTSTVATRFGAGPEVDAGLLGAVALAVRDTERIRFGYTARGGQAAGEDVTRHVEPHRLVTVSGRWYLLAYDLERHDWRSFRLDRMHDPSGTRATFRPREIPGGDAAAYVRSGLSRREQAVRFTVVVDAPLAHVETRIGPWATVTGSTATSTTLVIDASDPAWAMFGLGYLDAAFTLVDAPAPITAAMAAWSERFAGAVAG